MKNILITISLVLAMSVVTKAQTQAGNFLISGNLGWTNNEYENNYQDNTGLNTVNNQKNSSLTLQPLAGTFIKDNLAFGLSLNLEHYKNSSTYTSPNYNNTIVNSRFITIGPFIRKFFPLNEKFAFYGQGSLGYTYNSRKDLVFSDTEYNFNYKLNGFTTALKPGIVFFPSPKFGVDVSVKGLQYSLLKGKESVNSVSRMDADFNLPNLMIGLNLYLGR